MAVKTGMGAAVPAIGRRVRNLALAAGLALAVTGPALAQGQFSPAATVDGEVISRYDLDARVKFLTLLGAPGDVRSLALDQLVSEMLELRAAAAKDIVASPEAITAGMEEFAARGKLDLEQFTGLLAQAGIPFETFRDFVTAGVTWRDYVGKVLLPSVTISGADVDNAMATTVVEPGLRVKLSEIELPASDPATRKASQARAARLAGLTEAEFADAAWRFSIGPSRNNKGAMNWIDTTALPPQVAAAVSGLQPGQMSRIVDFGTSIKLYFMHDRETVNATKPRTVEDYAALLLPGGQSETNLAELARIRAEVTTCDDFYPIARALPPEQLVRETVGEGSSAYAGVLQNLDPGEITSTTTAGGNMAIVMLCSRGNELPRSMTRDMVSEQLRNSRVSTMAQVTLDEMKANANIVQY